MSIGASENTAGRLRVMFSCARSDEGYRSDIDGLRALAVVAVALFHAFPKQLPGGFVGVDIFFVISGFLISTILFRAFLTGTFSYAEFLARRLRRIFPALGTVMLSTIVVGWTLLTPQELLMLGKEITAGSLFCANILFWNQAEYFDTASDLKPLLHLWSLGLEEQFYLCYPPLLWFLFHRRWNVQKVLSVIALFSFAGGVYATRVSPEFAFYLLPTRFWELLGGALVAYGIGRSAAIPARVRSLLSLSGIVLIAIAIACTRENAFPGWWALLPVAGTSLFLLAGPDSLLNRTLFSFRPLVQIGLISYPFYLWHWPLLSFEHILGGQTLAMRYRLAALGLSLVLAALTYVAVEKPFRKISLSRIFYLMLPAQAFIAALGLCLFWTNGFPSRHAVETLNEGETDNSIFHQYGRSKYLPCEAPELRETALRYEGTLRCQQSRPGTQYDLILLGDSHAEHLFYGLAAQLPDKNVVYAVRSDMPVLQNASYRKLFNYLLQTKAFSHADLIVAAAWAFHFDDAAVVAGVQASVIALQHAGYRVFITDDVPPFPFSPSLCQFRRRLNLNPQICRTVSVEMDNRRSFVQKGTAAIAAATGAQVLPTYDLFRDEGGYFMARDGHLLYRDTQHLSINGSLYLAERLRLAGLLRALAASK